MIYPTRSEFREKSRSGNVIPVWTEILADTDTPFSAFTKIEDGPYSFLLESVEGSEKIGRYSFLGSSPKWVFLSRGNKITFTQDGKSHSFEAKDGSLNELKKILESYRVVEDSRLPRFFGGAVGYLGYGVVEEFDGIAQRKCNELALPDILFILSDSLIAFDHVRHRIKIIVNAFIDDQNEEATYGYAVHKLNVLKQRLMREKNVSVMECFDDTEEGGLSVKSNVSEHEFAQMVIQAKEYIKAGDIFQVVLSQRLMMETLIDGPSLYRALRSINPSPYMFLLKLNDFYVIGTSPEILVRCEDGQVEVRPIAGTRPRGQNEAEDQRLMEDLLADPKERAEHLMLIDLGRNDVGRVCDFGSIQVPELMAIEKYSHVMHIVSDVTGRLSSEKNAFDVLRSTFPAGTVTGAPKIRAMQIIEELENVHRGLYAGAIGYFSFSGDLDSCIAIRTVILKDGKAYIQAGAGIVADSVPETEYQETWNKARAMIKAVRMAERMKGLG